MSEKITQNEHGYRSLKHQYAAAIAGKFSFILEQRISFERI